MMITRQGKRSQAAEIVKTEDPRGGTIYWLGANGTAIDESEGTDFLCDQPRLCIDYSATSGYDSTPFTH